jgi:hypothetical protein
MNYIIDTISWKWLENARMLCLKTPELEEIDPDSGARCLVPETVS